MLADSAMFVALGFLMVDILKPKSNRIEISWLVCLLLLGFNFHDLTDTGWITTTLNYLWPTTAALWVMRPLSPGFPSGWQGALRWSLLLPIASFAANMELVAVFLLVVNVTYVASSALRRRVEWYGLAVVCIALGELVFILASPGNGARFAHDAGPEFLRLSFLEKSVIGSSLVVTKLYFVPNLLAIILGFALSMILLGTNVATPKRVIGLIPLAFSVVTTVLFFLAAFPELEHDKIGTMIHWVTREGVILEPDSRNRLVALALLVVALGSILLSLFSAVWALGGPANGFVPVGIFLLGMATKASLGFSPTAWASGERTSFLMSVSLIFLVGSLSKRWDFQNRTATSAMAMVIGFASVGSWMFNSANFLNLRIFSP
jgi:hypothetical protein